MASTAAAAARRSVELTTTWGVNAAYEHFWNKRWQTSLYGAYIATNYNSTANAMLCALKRASIRLPTCASAATTTGSYWDVGSRTQFNVDSQTYVGLDVIYTELQYGDIGVRQYDSGSGTQPTAARTISRSERVDGGVPLPS